MRIRLKVLMAASVILLLSASCTKMTDEHNEIDPALTKTMMDLINEDATLSKFATYLKQTGLDVELRSSKTYTVFAPADSYFDGIDNAIISDPVRLKKLLGNHISLNLYQTTSTGVKRIPMINGKYHDFRGTTIDDASITGTSKFGKNGILHYTNKVMLALDNAWEFMMNSSLAPVKQKAYLQTLFMNVFDPTNAVVTGIDPNTGAPIYQAGTDSVYTNLFWNRVFDLKNEQKQFTYFMLTDAAWDTENNKYKVYFPTTTTDSTNRITSWNVVKDFAVDTLYEPTSIPDTILSKFGTKLGIDRSAIVRTVRTSNGIVYIMNKLDVQPLHKFKTYLIQGENYNSTSNDRRGNTYFRDRFNTLTGLDFRDVLVYNHGVSAFNIRYQITEVPAIKYKAYWVALNDFNGTATFSQKLGIGDPTSTTFGYTLVNLANYAEVYIGEFTNPRYWPNYNIYLVAAASTTAAVNPIVCDYIKLVPGL